MIRPKIGLDWDDVTAPFNSIAIDMANKKYNITPPLALDDIDSWENTGRASVIKEFYRDNTLYERQKPTEETKRMIRKLRGLFYHGGGTGLHGSEGEPDNGGIS